ncbi:hypothetical protein [uncultured Phenylobacterium sp.]|uniref:hypothetical protein n=1 Tax=uncultured Phenylobacterium sp. TaxID=349273 RepID=UPI0025E66613|nr:hypothetical protein [uncultured Phenylobacterium sp.]
MRGPRADRAERLAGYFEAQLRLARRMVELTGAPLAETALNFTNLSRRFGLGSGEAAAASEPWLTYAVRLEGLDDLSDQVALTQATWLGRPQEPWPQPGQVSFGCFAHEPPDEAGAVKIHFYNRDTDESGGPLAAMKAHRRRGELAAMVAHIRETYPEARAIRGASWLYNLEAYRRLFPPGYVATREAFRGRPHLTGTSHWGQLIDSREAIRPDVRDAFVANLETLDPETPWLAFPFRALIVSASLETFESFYGLPQS